MIAYFTSRPPLSVLNTPHRTYNFNIQELAPDDPHCAEGYTHSAYPITVQASVSPSEALALVIDAYDKSNAVNGFFLNGKTEWIENSTRVSVMNSTGIEKAAGYATTTLWLSNKSYTMPCDLVISLLSAIEIYAKQCFNVTAEHQHQVAVLGDALTAAQDHYAALLTPSDSAPVQDGSAATPPAQTASPTSAHVQDGSAATPPDGGDPSPSPSTIHSARAAQQSAFEAILAYDFTAGYPDKLSINV